MLPILNTQKQESTKTLETQDLLSERKDKQNILIPQSVKENLNNDNQIVSVEVVPDERGIEELTPEEEQDKLRFERQVERAFYSAGVALVQLRDRRLYRNTHSTFESYCRERFNLGRHTANRLIAAIQVVDNLVTIVTKNQPNENISPQIILPTRESQVRPLVGLEPEKQHQAWTRAVKEAGGKTPTAKKVKEVVEQMYSQVNSKTPKIAHHLKLQPRGLVEINTPHLIDLHQRYARIHLIHQSTVEVWVRNMSSMTMRKQTFKHQQVEPVAFEKEPQLKEVRSRLEKLRKQDLDPFERDILMLLERPVAFTPREMEYLTDLEARYGIEH